MQIEANRVTDQEILGAYLTSTHFHEHYEKQGKLTRFLHGEQAVPELKLCH